VLARLRGDDDECFADNSNVRRALDQRGEGLLTFCINAEPILPMAQFMLQQVSQGDPGAAMGLSLLDIESLRCISGHVGIDDGGLGIEVALELAEGHRNLLFNLMRSEQVTDDTLRAIPEGTAFFLATAFNPAAPVAPILEDSAGQPVVTMMDFGREIFGNLVDVALFGLASEEGSGKGLMIPDVALAMRVNDPERSMALWNFALSLAAGASPGGAEGRAVEIAGAPAMRYEIEGIPILVAREGRRLLISPSEGAIARSIDAIGGRGSVLEDSLFAKTIERMAEGSVFLMMANPGRCARIATSYLPPENAQELAPVIGLLSSTVFATDVEHSETTFALKGRLSSIPDVSGLVAAAMRGERPGASVNGGSHPAKKARKVKKAKKKSEALTSTSLAELQGRFELLVRKGGDAGEIESIGRKIVELAGEDADFLNGFAWRLLTEETFGHRFDDLALEASKRSNKLVKFGNWLYLDTLAHAVFFGGNIEEAIDIERQAIELAAGDGRVGEAEAALKRFMAAHARSKEVSKAAPAVLEAAAAAEAVEIVEPAKKPAKKVAKAAKVAKSSGEAAVLREEFDLLVKNGADRKAVLGCGERILERAGSDAEFLNDFAWALITDEVYGGRFDILALDLAMRSNEASSFKVWQHVDTLAHAVFQTGDVEGAIGLAETALELVGEDSRRAEVEAALRRFQTAGKEGEEIAASSGEE
jgi:hypothetical protein